MLSLPTLDVSAFLVDPTARAGEQFVRNLRDACHGPGFLYLVGHGVAPARDAAIMAAARSFFALPEAERHAMAIGKSPHFRGYTVLGDEHTQGKRDWREQIDLGPEESPLELSPDDPPWLRLRGPNQWPPSLPGMRLAVTDWMQAMEPVGIAVMRALALGLGQPMDRFDAVMSPNPYTRLKIIRYPAQPVHADTGQGLGLHHDSGLVSFVLQDDVGGLQVQTGGRLVDALAKPGAYVMNLGEMLQAASSGYLRATKHRVESPATGAARISVAYFMNPRLDAIFEPLDLPPELAAQAPGGQNPDPHDPVFATFGENTLKIRMRAHPDVTAAFYSDVRGAGSSIV